MRHGASGAFVAAVDGEVLGPGDAIKTTADARAMLTFFEGSTVEMEPGTELAIDAAAPQGNDTIVQMTQSAGRTWHVVTKLVTGDSKYEVRTPASTASVRGTKFTVDADADTTTITTTEGTVLDRVPVAGGSGQTNDVPVTAGLQHSQGRGQGVGPAHPAPDPDRKVTITLDDEDSLVVDTLGRANGIDRNGHTLLQTPGATLAKVDGHLVITLPNIPDGRLQALTRKTSGEVNVTTTVEDKGEGVATAEAKIAANGNAGSAKGLAGLAKAELAIAKNSKGNDASPKSAPTESPNASTPRPQPTQSSGGGNGRGPAPSVPVPSAVPGPGNRPSVTPSGFVPPSRLPSLPPLASSSPGSRGLGDLARHGGKDHADADADAARPVEAPPPLEDPRSP